MKLKIAKQLPTKLICDRCGKDLTLNEAYSTPNGCECEKCKDISVAEFTSWQNGDINSPLRKNEYKTII
jgi:hypothetical protein